ncbi:hypothetical protein [Bacillus smithii]|uniref:hypothetical protein n=1 Tax=Bacillus smithii TaxID=1479 RepID=UPI003D233E7F
MKGQIGTIYKLFTNDETLLRLLYYPPKTTKQPDPLSDTLPNILEMDTEEKWNIIDNSIVLGSKSDDLETQSICRLYLYAGRRRSISYNYKIAHQEIIIDIFSHNSFEKDLRSMWISDRLNELLIENRLVGITKMDYVGGNPISAPSNYIGYRHIYEFEGAKK